MRGRLACLLTLLVVALCVLYYTTPLWAAPAAGDSPGDQKSVFDALVDSGVVGLVIIMCSIVGVSLAITFAFQIRRDVLVPPELLGQVEQLFEDEDFEEAYHVCEANPSFLSAVLSAGLTKLEEGYEEMASSMMETGEVESTKLHQKVGYLSLIANVAPMLGLLGTVLGMIMTFNEIANSAVQPSPKQLAGGISVALGTTFLGLTVAIPMTVVFVFFRNRVINVVVEVGAIAEELMGRFKGAGAA
jgi:biopolymer transport protein ExbB